MLVTLRGERVKEVESNCWILNCVKSLYLKVFLALEVRITSNELTYLGEHHKLPLTSQSAQGTFSCIFLSGVRGSHAEAKARFFKKQRQSLLWVSVYRLRT